jgi:hypothetical protein
MAAKQFALLRLVGPAPIVVYTVPAGRRAVLRTTRLTNTNAGAGSTVFANIRNGLTVVNVLVEAVGPLAAAETRRNHVLEAGDSVEVGSTGATLVAPTDVISSGSEFSAS